MTRQSTHWATGFLLLACAGLGGIVALEMVGRLPLAPPVTAAAPTAAELPTLPEPRQFQPPSPDQFAASAARPLFSPSRRPYVAPEEEVPEAPPPVVEVVAVPLTLVGVFLTEGRRMALLLPEDQARASWVREGEELAGWRVRSVEQASAVLQSGDRVEVVELRDDEATPAGRRPPQTVDRRLVRPGQGEQQARPDQPGEAGDGQSQQAETADD